MSLEHQPYEELCSNIRARPIGWDGYFRAHVITADELEKFKAIDKVTQERRIGIVERDPDAYARLFLGDGGSTAGILGRTGGRGGGGDIVQYILVLMGDLLESMFWSPSLIYCEKTRARRYTTMNRAYSH